ncbi:hypothetical protein AVEN_110720-1 [Araneus ventricosus]|uniref:Uncharacterized protein n=1 Tax=Araneus ventricosus TaxID=182803 RepID=A0A4Y2AUQ3_ARAVE|nr:hypothetical protein AVEN_110720-1 [Araneus ventricosus]
MEEIMIYSPARENGIKGENVQEEYQRKLLGPSSCGMVACTYKFLPTRRRFVYWVYSVPVGLGESLFPHVSTEMTSPTTGPRRPLIAKDVISSTD